MQQQRCTERSLIWAPSDSHVSYSTADIPLAQLVVVHTAVDTYLQDLAAPSPSCAGQFLGREHSTGSRITVSCPPVRHAPKRPRAMPLPSPAVPRPPVRSG
jgi:hypothetical protein